MSRTTRTSYLRGKRMRATRLDPQGRPIYGEDSVVSTKGFITVSYSTNVEEGEAVTQVNADGDTCVSDPARPSVQGVGVEAEFCEVDFALFEILTGSPIVLNDDGTAVGITESTAIDLGNIAFALELWLGADTKGAPLREGADGIWGYVLTPFLTGGVVGDISIENGAITFTVSNIASKNGAQWGRGPYAVELVNGERSRLRTPITSRDYRRIMNVEVAPPTVYSGSTPLLDPSAPEITTFEATTNGLDVTFTPSGSGAVFYDFGDGTWDYTATGSYTHTYEAPGTYDVVVRRGLSQRTRRVTVADDGGGEG